MSNFKQCEKWINEKHPYFFIISNSIKIILCSAFFISIIVLLLDYEWWWKLTVPSIILLILEYGVTNSILEALVSEFNSEKITIMITIEEVKALDDRIKSCFIENPDDEYPEYYVKIWFDFEHNLDQKIKLGRHEFVDESKEQLFKNIKLFMTEKQNGWKIIKI